MLNPAASRVASRRGSRSASWRGRCLRGWPTCACSRSRSRRSSRAPRRVVRSPVSRLPSPRASEHASKRASARASERASERATACPIVAWRDGSVIIGHHWPPATTMAAMTSLAGKTTGPPCPASSPPRDACRRLRAASVVTAARRPSSPPRDARRHRRRSRARARSLRSPLARSALLLLAPLSSRSTAASSRSGCRM